MELVSNLKSRETGYVRHSRTPKGYEKINLNFALRRLASQKEDLHMMRKMGMNVPPFACQFCKVTGAESVAAVANEDGDILLLDTAKKPGNRVLTTWVAHNNAVFDVSWLTHEQKLISVSGDHKATLWDVLEKKSLVVFAGHTGTVKCVDICPTQNAIFATGSRDGSVRIWDMRVPKRGNSHMPEIVIETSPLAPHPKSKPQKRHKEAIINSSLSSVTSLVFQNEHHVISSGVTDGVIKVWDLRRTYCSAKKQPKPAYQLSHGGSEMHGFSNLTMDSSHTQLYACCTNSIIYHYDCHTYNPQYVSTFYGHRSSSYYIKIAVSSDDRYLLSGSGDRFAYIWELAKSPLPVFQLPGHTEEVTAVAWSPLDLKIISCGDDEQILIWDIAGELEEESIESTIHCSAVPFDVSKFTKPPRSDSLSDTELLKSETPPVLRKRSPPPKTVSGKKTSPNCSSLSITQWFSPLNCCSSAKQSQKRSTPPEAKTPCVLVETDSVADSPFENELSKRRKSDEFESKRKNLGDVLSPSKVNTPAKCSVLSPSKTNCVDSGVLSPSKLNSVNDRFLSPSKTNCMTSSPETIEAKRVLNLVGFHNSGGGESDHKVIQNRIDKENIFCYEISPTSVLGACYSSESENCVPRRDAPGSSKTSFSGCKSRIRAVRKTFRKNRISKKCSKKEEKKKAERSIETYFMMNSSGCHD